MRLAQNAANQEDIAALNEVIFDLNIGEVLCEESEYQIPTVFLFPCCTTGKYYKEQCCLETAGEKDKDS